MKPIDRQQLSKFIELEVDHEDNPQSFKNQMKSQIDRYMKQHEQHLKLMHTKLKHEKIIEEGLLERQKLKGAIQNKLKNSEQKRLKQLEESKNSLTQLHQRRHKMHSEKITQQRKEQLRNSLKKIKEFDDKKEAMLELKASRSASQSCGQLTSRLSMRQETGNAHYEDLVKRLRSKGIFDRSAKTVQSLYSMKASHSRKVQEEEVSKEDKIGQSLAKIEKARKKKEAHLSQRIHRIEEAQKFQQENTSRKRSELLAQQRSKKKELEQKRSKQAVRVAGLSNKGDKSVDQLSKIRGRINSVPPEINYASVPQGTSKRSFGNSIRASIQTYLRNGK